MDAGARVLGRRGFGEKAQYPGAVIAAKQEQVYNALISGYQPVRRTVFLNYRHDDTAGYAGRLYDWLNTHFPERVFADVGRIVPGDNFVNSIERAVGDCGVMITLIGKQWLQGNRLHDPSDFVRIEIVTAIRRGIRVIPVLVGGGSLPEPRDLPADLADLCQRQALVLSDADWESGCKRLLRALERDMGPASGRSRKLAIATVAILITALVVSTTLYKLRPKSNQGQSPPAPEKSQPTQKPGSPARQGPELVGTWQANVVELGIPIEIIWHIWPDGSSSYRITTPTETSTANSKWTYADGVIYERPLEGSGVPSSGVVQWIDHDHFTLTILDNGDPGSHGRKRNYSRL
jgi:hypothetical protein